MNHWVIAGLVVVHQLLGMLWYSPFLFGYHWINASGFRLSAMPRPDEPGFYVPFALSVAASLLLCYALAYLFRRLDVRSARAGLGWALLCWAVFAFVPLLVHYQFAQRPWSLAWLDGGRDFIVFALTGAVIGALGFRNHQGEKPDV